MTQYARMAWQGRRITTRTGRGRRLAAEGLQQALEHTLGEARKIVPLDEGTLERSGRVVMNGLEGVISFDTVYAVRQLPARRAHLEAFAWKIRQVP